MVQKSGQADHSAKWSRIATSVVVADIGGGKPMGSIGCAQRIIGGGDRMEGTGSLLRSALNSSTRIADAERAAEGKRFSLLVRFADENEMADMASSMEVP
jgi:hypothetical protein